MIDLYQIVDRLFTPDDLKALGIFAALGSPAEVREWLRIRIAPKVEQILEAATKHSLPRCHQAEP